MTVDVEIQPRPLDDDEVMVVADIDDLVAGDRCSCSVGDDQPYWLADSVDHAHAAI